MEIVQVPDIKIAKNGQFHSLQNAEFTDKGIQQSFSSGSGVFKEDKLYVIGDVEIVRMTTLSQTPSFTVAKNDDITVDWGDGVKEINIFSHTYSDEGPHEIRFYGKASAITTLMCNDSQLIFLDVTHAIELN